MILKRAVAIDSQHKANLSIKSVCKKDYLVLYSIHAFFITAACRCVNTVKLNAS